MEYRQGELRYQSNTFLGTLRGIVAEAKKLVFPLTAEKAICWSFIGLVGAGMYILRDNLYQTAQNQNLQQYNSLPVIAQQYDSNKDGRLEGREISSIVEALQK